MDLHPSGMGNVTVKSAGFPASIVTKLLADIIEPLISDNLLWYKRYFHVTETGQGSLAEAGLSL